MFHLNTNVLIDVKAPSLKQQINILLINLWMFMTGGPCIPYKLHLQSKCMHKAAMMGLSIASLSSQSASAEEPHYKNSATMPQIQTWSSHITPGGKRHMWKWLYRSSTKKKQKKHTKHQITFGLLPLKSRTAPIQGGIESKGEGIRHPSKTSIFRVEFHFHHPKNRAPFSPPTPLFCLTSVVTL